MNITITEKAAEALKQKMKTPSSYIKLHYDTEGCGCSIDGVPVLWLVDSKTKEDEVVETNKYPILVEKSKKLFFDDCLTIDWNPNGTFQLKSANEILNGWMSLVDKTGQN
ncbi:MAG: iron-sulfur cluster biosynthesis family protein [Bacillales bacterium]|nr:iron-sulfur cluster biosynthesis family protein [Bacillales bacterium]